MTDVIVRTPYINVDPATGAITIENAGPVGPRGYPGASAADTIGDPVTIDHGGTGQTEPELALAALGGEPSGTAAILIDEHVGDTDPHGDRAWATTQLSGKANLVGGKLSPTEAPDITITDTSVVGSQAEMLALTAQKGDVAIRTDTSNTWILKGTDPTQLSNWQPLPIPTVPVLSVNGRIGAVDGLVDTTGPQTITGPKTFNSTGDETPVIVNGFAGQSAPLQVWNDAGGVDRARVLSYGAIESPEYYVNADWGAFYSYSGGSWFGAEAGGTNAVVFARSINSGQTGVIVRGYASQTANLQEWQDSSGSPSVYVASDGSFTAQLVNTADVQLLHTTSKITSIYGSYLLLDEPTPGDPSNLLANQEPASPALVVRGAAGQIASIFEIQNSAGGFLAGADADGWFYAPYLYSTGLIQSAGDITSGGAFVLTSGSYIGASTSPNSKLQAVAAGHIPLVVKGVASQTANLQEWQNSAGSVIAKVTSIGDVTTREITALQYKVTASTGAYYAFTGGSYALFSAASPNNLLIAGAAAHIPLVVKAFASQSADLQQWQDSAGSVLSQISAAGNLFVMGPRSRFGVTGIGGATVEVVQQEAGNIPALSVYGSSSGGGAAGIARFISRTAAGVGVVVQGAVSQTGNLQEWQDSTGAVKARADSSGALYAPAFGDSANISYMMFRTASPNSFLQAAAAAHVPLVIKGAASQSANLQEWQNSAGTVLAKISSAGGLTSNADLSLNSPDPQITHASGSLRLMGQVRAEFTAITDVFVVRGASGQTSRLQEWQDSNGTVSSYLSRFGDLSANQVGVGTQANAIGNFGLYVKNAFPSGWPGIRVDVEASAVGVIVKGAASQTGDLQQWQSSAASVLASVGSDGTIFTAAGIKLAQGSAIYNPSVVGQQLYFTGTTLLAKGSAVSDIPFTVRGVASQSGNLQEWQNSAGTVLAQIDLAGGAGFGRVGQTPGLAVGGAITANTSINNNVVGPSVIGLIIRAAASQSADLQQWQGSSGATVAKVNSTGKITALDFQLGGGSNALYTFSQATYFGWEAGSPNNLLKAGAAAHVPLVVKGFTSQSANLQEWQDSAGVVLASMTMNGATAGLLNIVSNGESPVLRFANIPSGKSGSIYASTPTDSGTTPVFVFSVSTSVGAGISNRPIYSVQNASGLNALQIGAHGDQIINVDLASVVPVKIKAAASQSANLQEWQNSAGTVVAAIGPAGSISVINGMAVSGGTVSLENSRDLLMGTTGVGLKGTSLGMYIATATTQKLGFWNTTPVVQPAGIADADGSLADITTKFNSLITKLETMGLLATV